MKSDSKNPVVTWWINEVEQIFIEKPGEKAKYIRALKERPNDILHNINVALQDDEISMRILFATRQPIVILDQQTAQEILEALKIEFLEEIKV